MKNIKTLIVILLVGLVAVILASTETHTGGGVINEKPGVSAFKKCSVNFGDVNDSYYTETLKVIYGYVERVVIDATGTDTAYKVYVRDENGLAIFSKEDCSTGDGDYSYAISMSDTGSTEFLGVPIGGAGSVDVNDANGLTDLDVILYYQRWWQ
ncbi:unnamed protein product [marine sediment metagenome]|uniref:Uncharacterized protein n=1 Tax=marine sediment metagenome TaxID=412755 RepID=X1M270_9ZZZZ